MMATRGGGKGKISQGKSNEKEIYVETRQSLGVRVRTSNYHYLAMTVYVSFVKGVGMVVVLLCLGDSEAQSRQSAKLFL